MAWDFRSFYPSLIHGLNLQKGFVMCVPKWGEGPSVERFHVLYLDEGSDFLYVSVKKGRAPLLAFEANLWLVANRKRTLR